MRVEVFNLLGQRVALLHDEEVRASEEYRFLFNTRSLPSGTYLYRAIGENFVSANRKLVVVR